MRGEERPETLDIDCPRVAHAEDIVNFPTHRAGICELQSAGQQQEAEGVSSRHPFRDDGNARDEEKIGDRPEEAPARAEYSEYRWSRKVEQQYVAEIYSRGQRKKHQGEDDDDEPEMLVNRRVISSTDEHRGRQDRDRDQSEPKY